MTCNGSACVYPEGLPLLRRSGPHDLDPGQGQAPRAPSRLWLRLSSGRAGAAGLPGAGSAAVRAAPRAAVLASFPGARGPATTVPVLGRRRPPLARAPALGRGEASRLGEQEPRASALLGAEPGRSAAASPLRAEASRVPLGSAEAGPLGGRWGRGGPGRGRRRSQARGAHWCRTLRGRDASGPGFRALGLLAAGPADLGPARRFFDSAHIDKSLFLAHHGFNFKERWFNSISATGSGTPCSVLLLCIVTGSVPGSDG
ncbi:translation initiation factor IF-2-like [Vulpes lagopus]|uniref:translation initiation factor IF-2-like n=1 Tax=Vulpes lagopus TaxID=494514 RepID=UPI001BCA445A|nr:translation initiation factor IF-2-like [Vulpes lagopus]